MKERLIAWIITNDIYGRYQPSELDKMSEDEVIHALD